MTPAAVDDKQPARVRSRLELLEPLPIKTRAYRGESLTSWAHRHARRNHLRRSILDGWIRENDFGHGLRHPGRVEAWRRLGNLHPSAFTTPDQVAGNWITERTLCLRCTAGTAATGKLPHAGMVCLPHHRWLGQPQQDLQPRSTPVQAERAFRAGLVPRGVVYDSPVMRLALDCATLTQPPATTEPVTARPSTSDLIRTGPITTYSWEGSSGHLTVYPSQVRYAELLTDPRLLACLADPEVAADDKHRYLRAQVAQLVSPAPPPWRVVNRLIAFSARLGNNDGPL